MCSLKTIGLVWTTILAGYTVPSSVQGSPFGDERTVSPKNANSYHYMVAPDGVPSVSPVPLQQWTLPSGSYIFLVNGGRGAVSRLRFNLNGKAVEIGARISSTECLPEPDKFTIPAGYIANNFTIEELYSGFTCTTGKNIPERGFSIEKSIEQGRLLQ